MAANVLQFHHQNPYRSHQDRQNLIIFSPSEPEVGILTRSLSPISLRVLLALASKLTPEGYAAATLEELANLILTSRTYVNQGILQLAKYKLISKKKRSQYWLSPSVFRPALIELGY